MSQRVKWERSAKRRPRPTFALLLVLLYHLLHKVLLKFSPTLEREFNLLDSVNKATEWEVSRRAVPGPQRRDTCCGRVIITYHRPGLPY